MLQSTQRILDYSQFFNVLIAIQTSAIVALSTTSFNHWIIASIVLMAISIVLVPDINKKTQLIINRQIERSKIQKNKVLEDALLDVVKHYDPKENDTTHFENGLKYRVICIIIISFCSIFCSIYGVRKNSKEVFRSHVCAITTQTDSLMQRYDSNANRRYYELTTQLNDLNDTMRVLRKSIKEQRDEIEETNKRIVSLYRRVTAQ